jgi:hypothetical protein
MNARERFRGTMGFAAVDRMPYWEFCGAAAPTLTRWRREGLPGDVYLSAYFDLDRAEGVPVDDGLVPSDPEVGGGHNFDTWQCMMASPRSTPPAAPALASHADLAALLRRLDPRSPRRYPCHWTDYLRCVRGRDYPVAFEVRGPLGRLIDLAGRPATAAFAADEPDLLDAALEAFTQFAVDLLRPVLASVGDVDLVLLNEDLFSESLTAEWFGQHLAKRYERLARIATDHGVPAFVLVCPGDLRAVLGPLREAGVTGLAPLTGAAGMDPVALRREHGRLLAFIGGIDAGVLAAGRSAIERAVRRVVPALLGQGWIPSLDRPVPPEVSLDDYRFYWELVRDLAEKR